MRSSAAILFALLSMPAFGDDAASVRVQTHDGRTYWAVRRGSRAVVGSADVAGSLTALSVTNAQCAALDRRIAALGGLVRACVTERDLQGYACRIARDAVTDLLTTPDPELGNPAQAVMFSATAPAVVPAEALGAAAAALGLAVADVSGGFAVFTATDAPAAAWVPAPAARGAVLLAQIGLATPEVGFASGAFTVNRYDQACDLAEGKAVLRWSQPGRLQGSVPHALSVDRAWDVYEAVSARPEIAVDSAAERAAVIGSRIHRAVVELKSPLDAADPDGAVLDLFRLIYDGRTLRPNAYSSISDFESREYRITGPVQSFTFLGSVTP